MWRTQVTDCAKPRYNTELKEKGMLEDLKEE